MAENANLTPKDGEDGGTPVLPETPEITPEGQEEKETPKETTPEGQEPKPEGDEEDTYKKRYADSSREAQRLQTENQLLTAQIEELAKKGKTSSVEIPSDTELSQSVPDWDLLSLEEQRLQKEQMMLKRELASIRGSLNSAAAQLQWEKDFGKLANQPDFKDLISLKQEFEHFCSKRANTSIEDSAKSFLFDRAKQIGAIEEKDKLERKGLEKGSGGIRTPKAPGLSYEERENLRKSDPKTYQKMVQKGLIKD